MIEPYFKSRTQRLYRFPNGYGASVVQVHDDTHELAVLKFRPPNLEKAAVPENQRAIDPKMDEWFIDYNSPLGGPKSGLAEPDVTKLLDQIESLKPLAGD